MLEQYTVEIDFPHGTAYPLKDGRFTQNPDDENIKYWDSENVKKCQIEGVL